MNDTILLVEDEEDDVALFLKVAKEVEVANPIQVAKDGQEAMDYFNGTGKFSNREEFPLPALVVLDLDLPYRMGMSVLQWLRAQPALKSTIVIVFTASESQADISRAYEEGVNAYLVKPPNLEGLYYLIRNLKNFWLNANVHHREIGRRLKIFPVSQPSRTMSPAKPVPSNRLRSSAGTFASGPRPPVNGANREERRDNAQDK